MEALFSDYEAMRKSGLFDPEYYLATYPDVAERNLDPLVHYLEEGAQQGRNPHPDFDGVFYLEQCRERGEQPGNPVMHYLRIGAARGFKTRRDTIAAQPQPESRPSTADRTSRSPFLVALETFGITGAAKESGKGSSRISLGGWALAGAPIDEITATIDGRIVGTAHYGLARPDVARMYPDRTGAARSGFVLAFDLPGSMTGTVEPLLTVRTIGGETGQRPLRVDIPPRQLRLPVIDPLARAHGEPESAATPTIQLAIDGAVIDRDGILHVQGWIVCLVQIEAVEAFLDGARIGDAEFGRARTDIAQAHPDYPNSLYSGFALTVDARQLGAGRKSLTITATSCAGIAGEASVAVEIPKLRTPTPADMNPSVTCHCDHITLTTAGRLAISGWAVGATPNAEVTVMLDGRAAGTAEIALPRPDIGNRFPALPHARQSGFALQTQTDRLISGTHRITVRVHSKDGKPHDAQFDVTASVEIPGDAWLDPGVGLVLDNIRAEAARADGPEELSPIVATLATLLDAAASRYLSMTAESAADLLAPADLGPEFRAMTGSLEQNYPVLAVADTREPVVSIVIPVFNNFELTYSCIKSIIEHGAKIPFEIVVVDDCSRDETLLAGLVFGHGISLVRNPANAGFVRSCNRGFDAARGDYVVFVNNDTEARPGWLDELYDTLQRDPAIGVVGAKLLSSDGRLQECGGIVWRLGDASNWGSGQAADDPRFCYLRDADYVSGAALMVRSSLFAELGKFDELFAPGYYEDTDLCFRVRQRGFRVVVQPAAQMIHFEGATAGTSISGTGMKRFQVINHRKFFQRWKGTLATHRLNGELAELEAERAVRQRALFIDEITPEPDKDAGSNAAFQHILSLQRLGYKVTFVPAANLARIDPYTAELQRRGIECLYRPYLASVEEVFRRRAAPFDLVYLHRHSNAARYAGIVRQHLPQARIVYNVADLHFLRTQRQAEAEADAKLRETAEQLRRIELGAMAFVDCVIVHSSVEAELLRQLAPDIEVRVIPWTVPLHEIAQKRTRKPAIAFIGGYGHAPNDDAAKWAALGIMPLLRQLVPGIELLLVGSNMPPEVAALAAKDIVPLGYVPSLDSVFERVRLTIAPLRYGAGVKGKVLESMAAGIPCVMTGIAAEGIGLSPELQQLVADDPAGLAERIALLCRDNARYRRVAAACKRHVAENYSAERIDALLQAACRPE